MAYTIVRTCDFDEIKTILSGGTVTQASGSVYIDGIPSTVYTSGVHPDERYSCLAKPRPITGIILKITEDDVATIKSPEGNPSPNEKGIYTKAAGNGHAGQKTLLNLYHNPDVEKKSSLGELVFHIKSKSTPEHPVPHSDLVIQSINKDKIIGLFYVPNSGAEKKVTDDELILSLKACGEQPILRYEHQKGLLIDREGNVLVSHDTKYSPRGEKMPQPSNPPAITTMYQPFSLFGRESTVVNALVKRAIQSRPGI